MSFENILHSIDNYLKQEKERIYYESLSSAVSSVLTSVLTSFESNSEDSKSTEILREIIQTHLSNLPQNLSSSLSSSPLSSVSSVSSVSCISQIEGENCNSIIKTGPRKGEKCGMKIHLNGMCKRHSSKESPQPSEMKMVSNLSTISTISNFSTHSTHSTQSTHSAHSSQSAISSVSNVVIGDDKCMFILQKGKKIGMMCGCAVKTGEKYCKKHKPVHCCLCCEPISVHSPSEMYCRVHLKNELNLGNQKFLTYTNKFGNIEHKYSGLVFDINKKVVGIQNSIGTITNSLSDSDLECVIVYGLPIDECFQEQLIDYLNRKKQKENGSS